MKKVLLIGLTGGIGAGKSEAAAIMAKLGAKVIHADVLGKEVVEENPEILKRIREAFGDDFFDENGALIRKKLGDLVFSDADKKKLLDEIVFPALYKQMKDMISQSAESYDVIVVDAALIFEWGITHDFDLVVTIAALNETVYQRLSRRDSFNKEQIQNRVKSQYPAVEKAGRSHAVIVNDSSLEKLRTAVEYFWNREVVPLIRKKRKRRL
ncbi:dephospho-CoA kinase [bacterium]|nr:dephospho-CoA kinase [FCB group bacterium]MBL7191446.1 dephospho-CoA kinase [bacterium]